MKRILYLGICLWAILLSISVAPLARAADVVVLDDPTYVDTSGNTGDEADNIVAAIESLAHSVALAESAGDLVSEDLSPYHAVVIPELENAAFDLNQVPLEGNLRDYVLNGGRLIISREVNNDNDLSVLNDVFQFNVLPGTFDIATTATAALNDTLFQTGPANLANNNLVSCLAIDSLPPEAVVVYANGNNASVVIFPFGEGEVISFGWDWNNSNPPWNVGGQDGGWHLALALALKNVDLSVSVTPSTTTPVVGQEFSLDIQVTNPHFWIATGVTAVIQLPGDLELVTLNAPVSLSDCQTVAQVDGTTITCSGDLNGTETIGLVVLPKSAGEGTVSVAVDSQQLELNEASNYLEYDYAVLADSDGDGLPDASDNCPSVANEDQADADLDGVGDPCEALDADGDGTADGEDNCPTVGNVDQADADLDGVGDVCEGLDADGDGILDGEDNCPGLANPEQSDEDQDGEGDTCDLNAGLNTAVNGGGCSLAQSHQDWPSQGPAAAGFAVATILLLAVRFRRGMR